MADVSHGSREDLSTHPDAPEMQQRYARVMGGRDVALMDGPVFLVGLYCAISPWVLHFTATQPSLMTHNLIMGITIGLLALGFTINPARMYGLSWAMIPIGAWLIVAPWVVGSHPDKGVIISNAVIGGLTALLGMVCGAAAMRSGRRRTETQTRSRSRARA